MTTSEQVLIQWVKIWLVLRQFIQIQYVFPSAHEGGFHLLSSLWTDQHPVQRSGAPA